MHELRSEAMFNHIIETSNGEAYEEYGSAIDIDEHTRTMVRASPPLGAVPMRCCVVPARASISRSAPPRKPYVARRRAKSTPVSTLARGFTGLAGVPTRPAGYPSVGNEWIRQQRQLRAPSPDQTVSRGVKMLN